MISADIIPDGWRRADARGMSVVDERAAFAYLTRISQNGNVKLDDVAARTAADTATGPTWTPATATDPFR